MPETKIRVGALAYREFVILGVALNPLQMKLELNNFYNHFKSFVDFPRKNLDHYPLMLRKLTKSQVIYYDQNRPVLTVKGKIMLDEILETMPPAFNDKWKKYLTQSY